MNTDTQLRTMTGQLNVLVAAVSHCMHDRTGKRHSRDDLREQTQRLAARLEEQLAGKFQVEGNKTYLVQGTDRTPMTADQRRDWISAQVQEDSEYAQLHSQVVSLDREIAGLEDEIATGQMKISALKLQIRAEMLLLQMGLPDETS